MSFGIGAFPFGFFTSSFNFGEPRPAGELQLHILQVASSINPNLFFFFAFPCAAANRGTTQYDDEQMLSKLFLYLAFLCIGWLLFA